MHSNEKSQWLAKFLKYELFIEREREREGGDGERKSSYFLSTDILTCESNQTDDCAGEEEETKRTSLYR